MSGSLAQSDPEFLGAPNSRGEAFSFEVATLQISYSGEANGAGRATKGLNYFIIHPLNDAIPSRMPLPHRITAEVAIA